MPKNSISSCCHPSFLRFHLKSSHHIPLVTWFFFFLGLKLFSECLSYFQRPHWVRFHLILIEQKHSTFRYSDLSLLEMAGDLVNSNLYFPNLCFLSRKHILEDQRLLSRNQNRHPLTQMVILKVLFGLGANCVKC